MLKAVIGKFEEEVCCGVRDLLFRWDIYTCLIDEASCGRKVIIVLQLFLMTSFRSVQASYSRVKSPTSIL